MRPTERRINPEDNRDALDDPRPIPPVPAMNFVTQRSIAAQNPVGDTPPWNRFGLVDHRPEQNAVSVCTISDIAELFGYVVEHDGLFYPYLTIPGSGVYGPKADPIRLSRAWETLRDAVDHIIRTTQIGHVETRTMRTIMGRYQPAATLASHDRALSLLATQGFSLVTTTTYPEEALSVIVDTLQRQPSPHA